MANKLKPVFSLLIFVALWGSLEKISDAIYSPTHLDQLKSILEEDTDLIWKQRSNFNGSLLNKKATTNDDGFRHMTKKNNSKGTILNLGASPTFGLGVNDGEDYSSQMQKMFRNYTVINAGVVGYSSFQGKKIAANLIKKIKPDFVTISYMVNDIDSARFYRNSVVSDKNLEPEPKFRATLRNLLSHSNVYRLIDQLRRKSKEANSKAYDVTTSPRVSLSNFRSNIAEIASIAKENGATPILLQLPIDRSRRWRNKQTNEKMKEKYSLLLTMAPVYLEELDGLAEQFNYKIVDLRRKFYRNREPLFATPIHPNPEGHRQIAKALYKVIAPLAK